jgi:deoxyribonuclease-4
MPTGKGLPFAVRAAKEMGCTAVQVFTSSPRMWKAKPLDEERVSEFRAAAKETNLDKIISHDTYLVNLCHADEDVAIKSLNALNQEIERCEALGIGLVVSHMGALLARSPQEGYAMIAKNTKLILDTVPAGVCLCMETTAGQGSSVNSRFEEIATLLDLCGSHSQLGVCLDTCHIYAAGYDIRTKETYAETMENFDRIVGISNLKVIHLNDSKKGLGSRVDRHDNIGKGSIGMEAFSFFVNDERLSDVPMVVETPIENEGHKKDLETLISIKTNVPIS